MALIGTLVSFSAGTKILSADVNSNFTAIRNAFNATAVLTDTATTITVTHIFSVSQRFSLGITTSGTSTLGGNVIFATDATYDIGAVATTRPRSAYVATSIVIGADPGNDPEGNSDALRMTGDAFLSSATARAIWLTGLTGATINIVAATATQSSLRWINSDGKRRWQWKRELDPETGADAGSSLMLQAFNDAGTFLDTPMTVTRALGAAMTFGRPVTISGVPNSTTALTITGYSVTGASTAALFSATGTWNTSGSPTALLINVTNTASGAASMLIDAKVGSVSKFSVSKDGSLTSSGLLTAGGGAVLASSISVSLAAGSVFFNGTGNAGTQLIDISQGINNTLITVGGAASLGGVINIRSTAATCAYQVNALPVVGTRKTGWTLPTGTLTRTGFTTTGATVGNVAEALAALIVDLHSTSTTATSVTGHGLIGT